jgi:hypothetical protein
MEALIHWLAEHFSASGGQILASVMQGIVQGTAIIIASIIGVRAYYKLLNRRHSFELLMTAGDVERVDLNLYQGSVVDGNKVDAREMLDDKNRDLLRNFCLAMNNYQYICQAVIDGLLDKDVVLKARFGGMKSLWSRYEDVVTLLRQRLDRPQLWKEVELFVASKEMQGAYLTTQKSYMERFGA